MTLAPKIQAFDPIVHLATNYPTWFVTTADLGGRTHEIISPGVKTLVVDPAAFDDDVEMALAHAVVHLDEHMGQICCMTPEACEEADYLAQIRLDRPQDRC